MIDFKRVDHIHICVPPDRLDEAKQFYIDVIGLEKIDRPDHLFSSAGFWFNIGDTQLHIGFDANTARTIRHTAFEVADINAARKQLSINNVEIIEDPYIPGRKRFAFIDPFGNRMELLQLTT